MSHAPAWELARKAVSNGESAVLVIVVEHRGSVPGKTGTMMVVTDDTIRGTVGGGLIEHQLINLCRSGPETQLFPFVHDGESTDSICSGSQTVAVVPLGPQHLESITALATMTGEDRVGTLTVTPQGPRVEPDVTRVRSYAAEGDRWTFITPFGPLDTLTIIGGGHVGLALSRVMATLPFRVIVLDDRDDLQTLADNHWAHDTRKVDWCDVDRAVPEGERSWAVIMTRGHRHDTDVLRKLLPLDLRYLGLMGSDAKVRQVFAKLKAEGFAEERLSPVHAPVGLPIGSHTPEEIAISVAAEIIRLKNLSARSV